MKKQLLTIMVAFATCFAMAQSIPNGGFENWTSQTCRNPQFFNSSNLQMHGGNNIPGPINVVRTTDASNDSFAVKMTTTLVGTDTSQAYIADFNPGGSSFTGGIPYSQQPTSLRFRYKCNVMPGDTALIILIFKKSGVIFSQNIKKIYGTQNTYALGTMTLSLPMAPDSIMFAAAASNVMVNHFPGIPGSMLQLDSINFGGVSSQPADMNGDFENWQTFSTNPVLNQWGGIGNSTINNQTTDKYAGNFALELKSTQTNQAGDSVYTSNTTTGYSNGGFTVGGYPYALNVDTLKFHYKYAPGGTSADSALIQLNFKKNGLFIGGQSMMLKAAASYTQAVMSFSLGTTPDSVIVNINSSKRWLLPISYMGSDLKIDNMYFVSQSTPVTNFGMPAMGCVGMPVQLMDMSSNIPTTWTWTTTGGNPSNSHSQNPIVTYTNTGTYTVTLNTSNSSGMGTSVSQTISINAPSGIMISGANTTCSGQPLVLSGGGASIVSYTWTAGPTTQSYTVSPTSNTTYTLTGTDASGCINMQVATVTVNPLPVISTQSGNVHVCSNVSGLFYVNSAGTNTYQWYWAYIGTSPVPSSCDMDNGAYGETGYTTDSITVPNLSTEGWGNYFFFCVVTNTATGCYAYSNPDTITTSNTNPIIYVNSGAICTGQSFTITPTGADTYTYSSGSAIVTPTMATTSYTVSGTLAGCASTGTAVATVTVNTLPTLTITPSTTTLCIGSTVTLTASGASTYSWSNTGATTISVTPSPTVTTDYTVTGTDGNGCANTSTQLITVNICGTSIEINANNSSISLFPNPNNGLFTIKGNTEINDLHIINELGQVIQTLSLKQVNNYEVNLNGLDKGIYFLIGNITKQRFIVIN